MKTPFLARSLSLLTGLAVAVALCSIATTTRAQVTYYSNLTNFSGQGFAPGGATNVGGSLFTAMAADDLNLAAGSAGQGINSFTFSVANFNAVSVTAQVLVNFYMTNGTGGGPGR